MTERAYNFNAGPAALPFEVLQKAQEELTDYQGIGHVRDGDFPSQQAL